MLPAILGREEMKRSSLLLLLAATAACSKPAANNVAANVLYAPAPANAATAPASNATENVAAGNAVNGGADAPYHANGTEPFWSLTIGGGEIVYDAADAGDVTVRAPAPQPIPNGLRYVTSALTVEITHTSCNNGMSEETFADTVRLTIGAETRNGCGGEGDGRN
jgi:uncharacterized membrane protein